MPQRVFVTLRDFMKKTESFQQDRSALVKYAANEINEQNCFSLIAGTIRS